MQTLFRPAAAQTWGSRERTSIDMIVVHVTESDSFEGTLTWFETPTLNDDGDEQLHPAASAHYVIAADGRVCSCVAEGFAAWHAGNKPVNLRSIGIEITGITDKLAMPEAQTQALAALIADIRTRHVIPLDRDHLIGHQEVPDPKHLGVFGGAGHHSDPGPHFNWVDLMSRLVPVS